MDIDSDVDSPDEELEEGLPICVQGNLSSLRSDRFNLINARKTLRRQLEESQMWSRELEKQLDSVRARVVELEAMVTPAAEECVKCQQLQLQLAYQVRSNTPTQTHRALAVCQPCPAEWSGCVGGTPKHCTLESCALEPQHFGSPRADPKCRRSRHMACVWATLLT